MAEEEINYASVVFKTKEQPQSEVQKEEETVYDEVKTHNQAADLNVSAGFSQDKKATNRHHHYQLLACCLGTFCVILLLAIIAVSVFLSMYNVHVSVVNEFEVNQTTLLMINHNLTVDNNELRLQNDDLRRGNDNQTVIIGNLTQKYTISESRIAYLTEEKQKLTAEIEDLNAKNNKLNKSNQELETQKNNLTEQIQRLSENSIAQIQQNIDAYCPKDGKIRQCKPCEEGWKPHQSSCYAINNAEPVKQKTWKEAQDDCRGKNSDLAVIVNENGKKYIIDNSWYSSGIKGYWIGLRVEDGRWKWIDGSDLTESYWIQQRPINGHCAISVLNEEWKSVYCGEKNGWICQKKALSV